MLDFCFCETVRQRLSVDLDGRFDKDQSFQICDGIVDMLGSEYLPMKLEVQCNEL
jgi:hypothetical protein